MNTTTTARLPTIFSHIFLCLRTCRNRFTSSFNDSFTHVPRFPGFSSVFLLIHGLLRISCSRNPKTPQSIFSITPRRASPRTLRSLAHSSPEGSRSATVARGEAEAYRRSAPRRHSRPLHFCCPPIWNGDRP